MISFKLLKIFVAIFVSSFQESRGDGLYENPRCECGQEKTWISRIVGGNETLVNQFPWTVGLHEDFSNDAPFCMGVLVSNVHILTAAHCLEETVVASVSLGDHDYTRVSETKAYRVNLAPYGNDEALHPDYVSGDGKKFPRNDIAILELPRPLNFNLLSRSIRPLCLPSGDLNTDSDPSGKPISATVAGWGKMGFNGKQSTVLRHVDLEVLTNKACNTMFPASFGGIKPFHLCAYTRGKDACQGDSGGALFYQRPIADEATSTRRLQLIGLVSFGDKCGTIGKPGGYTRVSYYMDWIVEKMMETSKRKNVTICAGSFGKYWQGSARNSLIGNLL